MLFTSTISCNFKMLFAFSGIKSSLPSMLCYLCVAFVHIKIIIIYLRCTHIQSQPSTLSFALLICFDRVK